MIGFIRPWREIVTRVYMMGWGCSAVWCGVEAHKWLHDQQKINKDIHLDSGMKAAFIVPASIVGGFMWPVLLLSNMVDMAYMGAFTKILDMGKGNNTEKK